MFYGPSSSAPIITENRLVMYPPPYYKNIRVKTFDDYFSKVTSKVSGFKSIIIIGDPGTGKTTTCDRVVDWINAPESYILTSSPDDYEGKKLPKNTTILDDDNIPDIPEDGISAADFMKEYSKGDGGVTNWFVSKMIQYKKAPDTLKETLIILDDVSDQLKLRGVTKALESMLKKLRHFKIHIVVVAHTPNDISPRLRSLFRYNIITGMELRGNHTVNRDIGPYFAGTLNKNEREIMVSNLLRDEALFVVKKGYFCKEDIKTISGSYDLWDKLPPPGKEWYKTTGITLIDKSSLFI